MIAAETAGTKTGNAIEATNGLREHIADSGDASHGKRTEQPEPAARDEIKQRQPGMRALPTFNVTTVPGQSTTIGTT
jgi:hypothetical protein